MRRESVDGDISQYNASLRAKPPVVHIELSLANKQTGGKNGKTKKARQPGGCALDP
jgi:hypothetical protein